MTPLFVDTAGWMACADAGDRAHAPARAARDRALKAGRPLLTTDYVVDESLTLIRRRLGLSAADAWWQQIAASARLRWERIDGERFDKARELFFRHKDKDFSFTDCTSFIVMQQLRLTSALTTDAHFRQMGFHVLPGRMPARRAGRG